MTFQFYPELYALVGGSVPDYRGLFLRGYGWQSFTQENGGWAGGYVVPPEYAQSGYPGQSIWTTWHGSEGLGVVQGDAIRPIRGHMNGDKLAYYASSGVLYHSGHDAGDGKSDDFNIDVSRMCPVSTEIRPANMSVRYFIRASD